ncbi:MAG: MarR family transcriptional regulator [Actinomycetota bacterium]
MANAEPDVAQGSSDAYGQVELELAILLRRGNAGAAELSVDVHPGLQATAYALLARLHELGSARAADLSDYFGIDKGSLSRLLKLLESRDLITREPDTADRRSLRLSLTEGGARRLAGARRARRRLIRRELSRWPACDVQAFGELLARFNALSQDQR